MSDDAALGRERTARLLREKRHELAQWSVALLEQGERPVTSHEFGYLVADLALLFHLAADLADEP